MDFGVAVGFDGSHSDPERLNNKRYGSGADEGDDWGSSKLLKTDLDCNNNSASKAMLFQQQRSNSLMRSNATLFPSDGHQMLSFSSPKSETQSTVLHNYFHHPFSDYNRSNSSGCVSGYSTSGGGGLHGILSGVRGPFTPSQWMELEHQALIYKYITANVPIPSNLLIPIRKALDSGCGLLRPNTLGWGSYHVGFSGNMDPEPGRCRRTDGKKWRCSRDAVADQKYCVRHMNRGRHRSRKPVEGQAPINSPKLSSTPIAHLNSLHPPAPAPNRVCMSKDDVCDPKSMNNQFLIPKQQNPFEQASRGEFGLVPSDSLLNPSNKSATVMSYKSFGSPHDRDSEAQHSLRQFMDDWPKSHSDRSAMSWPELDTRSDRTQLSISIPRTPNNNNEKVTLSPLRLSHEFDPIQMGLGVGSVLDKRDNRQANWIPISWETSMGGPLGEVLHNTNSSTMECKNSSSALNLMTEGWDSSPQLGSSPTGVLQKTSFGSLSNSSAGSSPRAHEGASFCNDLLGAPLVNSSHSGRY